MSVAIPNFVFLMSVKKTIIRLRPQSSSALARCSISQPTRTCKQMRVLDALTENYPQDPPTRVPLLSYRYRCAPGSRLVSSSGDPQRQWRRIPYRVYTAKCNALGAFGSKD